MYEHYYNILELPSSASLNEIKRAFRIKAKQYHPDLNSKPGAKELFLKINEAYSVLLNLKQNPPSLEQIFQESNGKYQEESRRNFEQKRRDLYEEYIDGYDNLYKEWFEYERKKAREKARFYAQQKFEEYKNSKLYKTTRIFFTIFDYIYYTIGFLIVSLFVFLFVLMGYRFFEQILHRDGTGRGVVLAFLLIFYTLVGIKVYRLVKYRLKTLKTP